MLCVGLVMGCGHPEDVGSREAPLINGTEDKELGSVGVIARKLPSGVFDFCGGTLIAPDLVLTAAHCLVNASEPYELPGELVFLTGKDAGVDIGSEYTKGKHHVIKDRAIHSGYSGPGKRDIAVVRIEPAATDTPYRLATTAPSVGQPMTLVGFGLTQADSYMAGVRHSGTNAVHSVTAESFRFTNENHTTALGCGGDSGSPALAQQDGQTVVAGVMVGVLGQCETTITHRVDVFRPWIENQMAILKGQTPPHVLTPDSPAGDGYGAGCEDGTSCASELCLEIPTFWSKYKVCSQRCSASDPCPNGDECHPPGYCLAKLTKREAASVREVKVAPTHRVEGSCSVSGDAPSTTLALLALLLWVAVRRRPHRS